VEFRKIPGRASAYDLKGGEGLGEEQVGENGRGEEKIDEVADVEDA
jgi:hypothetical protein